MALMSPENLIHDISPNAAPSWVCGQIEQVPKLTLIHFAARAWCGVHDVYACAFTPEARLDLQPTSPSLYAKHRARDLVPERLIRVSKALLPERFVTAATDLLRRGRS